MGEQKKSDILQMLTVIAVGMYAASVLCKVVKWTFSLPDIKKTPSSIPVFDTGKTAKIEGCLCAVGRGLSCLCGFLSLMMFTIAATTDRSAWQPGVAFGVFGALLYVLFSSHAVGKSGKRTDKNNAQKRVKPALSSNHSANVAASHPPQKRVGMIIAASFFALSSFGCFIMSFSELEFLGPAVGAGILSFMFIVLSKTPATKTHIWKLSKPAFVILCLIAVFVAGTVIAEFTPPINTR